MTPETDGGSLPRLCYVGNVPVEASIHGSALMWRLLEPYPKDKLLIVECEHRSKPEGRLPGVRYERADMHGSRLLFSRAAPYALPFLFRFSRLLAGPVRRRVEEFRPQAILTVAHELYWKVASEIAGRLEIPLHLIVHDAVLQMVPPSSRLRPDVEAAFARVYSSAASRLCISPYMAQEFQTRYGTQGTVLYPSRARLGAKFDAPPERLGVARSNLTAAFAGSIYPSYATGFVQLARELRTTGGRLLIFGLTDRVALERMGLALDNVEFRGMVSSEELKVQCRNEADFLFVPMSFRETERLSMEICFPSKLADYTAIGCPLLIRGPSYCSAVRWARANPSTSEIVDTEDSDSLKRALNSLEDPETRWRLGTEALRVGERYFSASRATQILDDALLNGNAK